MIYELLFTGNENARTARELSSFLHIDPRSLTIQIEKERRAGKPICASSDSDNPGYYIAANKEELLAYCNKLAHRSGEIEKTRQGCLKCLDDLPE